MIRLILSTLSAAVLLAAPLLAENAPGHRVIVSDSSRGHVVILDEAGAVEWEYKVGPLHDLHVLPSGNILLQKNWRHVVEVTPDKKTVWEYKAEGDVEIHAFQRLPDGNTMIAESGKGRIIEVTPDGRIAKQFPMKLNRPHRHKDTRLARKLDNGHYLVAHEGDGFIREYDAAGKVVWEYEVPLFGKPTKGGHGPGAWGNKAFSALRLPNGNTLIGTGNGHSVIEVTPEKEVVWHLKQNDLPGITLAWVTSLEVLPNGNIVVGNCHAGQGQPQLVEVTRDKKVAWKLYDWKVLGNSTTNSQLLDIKGTIR